MRTKMVKANLLALFSVGILALSTLFIKNAEAASAQPSASLSIPNTAPFIGQNYSFTINFTNASSTQPGFGPYVDLYMPATGIDGRTAAPLDGSDLVSANYLGAAITITPFTLNASNQFVHPYAKDSAGNFLIVTAPNTFFPAIKFTSSNCPSAAFRPGNRSRRSR